MSDTQTHIRGADIGHAAIVDAADASGISVTLFVPRCNMSARFTNEQAKAIIAAIQLAIGEAS